MTIFLAIFLTVAPCSPFEKGELGWHRVNCTKSPCDWPPTCTSKVSWRFKLWSYGGHEGDPKWEPEKFVKQGAKVFVIHVMRHSPWCEIARVKIHKESDPMPHWPVVEIE